MGEDIVLRIEGINSTKEIQTKIYKVPIRDKKLCKNFNVSPSQVKRPTTIDLLLSSKSNYLMSDEVYKSHEGIKLYGGPLGKTFGGVTSDLSFNSHVKSYPTKVFPVLQSTVKRASYVKEPSAMRDEWTLCRVDVNPDESNIVTVAPSSLDDASKPNKKGVAMINLRKHVDNVPHGENDVEAGHGGECKNE